jgi:hypothetical protein
MNIMLGSLVRIHQVGQYILWSTYSIKFEMYLKYMPACISMHLNFDMYIGTYTYIFYMYIRM